MAVKKKAAAKSAPKKVAPVVAKKPQKQNVVVVDFSEETKDLLRSLIEVLGKSPAPVKQIAAAQPAPVATAPVVKTTSTTVSLTEIRELINEKAGQGKTAAIVKLLGNHGAQSASTLAEENYDAFFTDLKEL